MYKIEWRAKAFRQLRGIADVREQQRIYAAVGRLEGWPACPNVKALQGRNDYRLRVGRWRMIFEVFQAIRVILIEEVRKRDEHTY